MRDGVYQAIFRTGLGEDLSVATLMDGHVEGRGLHVRFSGSLRELPSTAQAVLDVCVRRPAGLGVATFGAAEQVSLVLDGPGVGPVLTFEGALPGVPGEAVSLELRSVR